MVLSEILARPAKTPKSSRITWVVVKKRSLGLHNDSGLNKGINECKGFFVRNGEKGKYRFKTDF